MFNLPACIAGGAGGSGGGGGGGGGGGPPFCPFESCGSYQYVSTVWQIQNQL